MGCCVQCLELFTQVFVLPHEDLQFRQVSPKSIVISFKKKRTFRIRECLLLTLKNESWLLSRNCVCAVLNRNGLIISIFAALAVSLETVILPCSSVSGEMFSLEQNRDYEHENFEPNYLVLEIRLKCYCATCRVFTCGVWINKDPNQRKLNM